MVKEILKAKMSETNSYAYTVYLAGEDMVPMEGDQFFLMDMEEGDEWDGIIMKSVSEDDFFEWNHNGWWQHLSDEDVPDELCT